MIDTPFADSLKNLSDIEKKVENAKKFKELKMPIKLDNGMRITNIEHNSLGEVFITCNDRIYDFKELDMIVDDTIYGEILVDKKGEPILNDLGEVQREETKNIYEDIIKKLNRIFK